MSLKLEINKDLFETVAVNDRTYILLGVLVTIIVGVAGAGSLNTLSNLILGMISICFSPVVALPLFFRRDYYNLSSQERKGFPKYCWKAAMDVDGKGSPEPIHGICFVGINLSAIPGKHTMTGTKYDRDGSRRASDVVAIHRDPSAIKLYYVWAGDFG